MCPHFALAILLALAAPATLAQTAPKPLTPPEVLGAAKTIQFTATYFTPGSFSRPGAEKLYPSKVSEACLEKPNKAIVQDFVDQIRAEYIAKRHVLDTVYACDGKTQIEYENGGNQYTKSDAPARYSDADTHTLALSALTKFLMPSAFSRFKYVPMKSEDGDISYSLPLNNQDVEWLVVDPKSGLPKALSVKRLTPYYDFPRLKKQIEEVKRIEFSDWKLNAPIANDKFHYTPPASAALYTPPKLLANGTFAPDFTVNDKDSRLVKLSDYKGKTIILDFWATWCGPCQESLPHTTNIAQKYAKDGVIVLAVNISDTPEAFQKWLPEHPQYGALHFVIDQKGIAAGQYNVVAIPTQYLIGKDGKIVTGIIGYDEESFRLEDALKASGVE